MKEVITVEVVDGVISVVVDVAMLVVAAAVAAVVVLRVVDLAGLRSPRIPPFREAWSPWRPRPVTLASFCSERQGRLYISCGRRFTESPLHSKGVHGWLTGTGKQKGTQWV
jgi:hypothetical protein